MHEIWKPWREETLRDIIERNARWFPDKLALICYPPEKFENFEKKEITFKEVDDAIRKVNNTKYGLQAGIFTRDITKALKCADSIDAGGVLINELPTFRVDNMPYGGTKGSGIGREGPEFAVKEMTEEKLVIFDQLP